MWCVVCGCGVQEAFSPRRAVMPSWEDRGVERRIRSEARPTHHERGREKSPDEARATQISLGICSGPLDSPRARGACLGRLGPKASKPTIFRAWCPPLPAMRLQ